MEKRKALSLLTIVICSIFTALSAWFLLKSTESKVLNQVDINRGKISVYKIQEVEELQRFKELTIVKDSIKNKLDSLDYRDFENIDSIGVQSVLDKIFNY